MKNIAKVNQNILRTWERAETRDRAVTCVWRGVKHVGVTVSGGAALIAVNEELSPFNFDALARRLPAFDMTAIIRSLSDTPEEALGELSGISEKKDKQTLVQVVGGDRSAWLDQKLVQLFGAGPLFKFYKGRVDMLTVFSPSGAFLGIICPVRRKEDTTT